MGGGVAGAIKRAGGQEIETEAVSKEPIAVGEAVVTGAGRLKAKYIIHAAVMGQDLTTDADKIRQTTRNSLIKADELGIKSLAFPALGTGVGGLVCPHTDRRGTEVFGEKDRVKESDLCPV
jgi:O-acetyl-ADP-ribose deacetylase (regulator of RNase III)